MELTCAVQNYHWGKSAGNSTVAKLAQGNGIEIDRSKNYAEFWMGTHDKGPSTIKATGRLLSDFLKCHPEAVSLDESTTNLPYLFKVLSVDTALSIQAHPDKKHAEQLHASRPSVYKDDNHKPEMALAVTEFEGLCGFRPLQEIQANLKDKELAGILGDAGDQLSSATLANYQTALKNCISKLMQSDKDKVAKSLNELQKRLLEENQHSQDSRLFLRLMKQYPGDVGCFMLFFLNVITLQPGEAMFLGANVPHAYLHGDCIECMSRSDNVVRAGLTPKLIDVDTLVEMLDYTCVTDKHQVKFQPSKEHDFSLLYDPPIPDFSVAKIAIKSSKDPIEIVQRSTGSILLVVQGLANYGDKSMGKGTVLFVPANESLALSSIKDLLAFQAFF